MGRKKKRITSRNSIWKRNVALAYNGLRIKNRFNVFYTLLPAGAVHLEQTLIRSNKEKN